MQESIRHAEQLLEKAEVVTLAVNGEDGCPRAYVMTKLPGESIRVFPFLAKEGSEKVRALEKDPRACVSYFAPGGSVSLTGTVQLIRESSALRELWVPELDRIFERLRTLRDELEQQLNRPLPELSMGMSQDFRAAIAEGATIVRIGTAIFGGRPRN